MAKKRNSRKRKNKQGFISRHALPLTVTALVLVCAVIAAAWFGLHRYKGEARWIIIPANSTSSAIADSLKKQLGNVEGARVHMLWKLSGGSPAHARGRYKVEQGEYSARTAWRLRGGMQTPVKIHWSDIRTMDQLANRIADKMEFNAEDFLTACNKILPDSGFRKEEFPAAFIPDQYEFYATSSAENVVKKLLSYRNKFWNRRRVSEAQALGLNPNEAATLASIVEEESAKEDELPVIARLYLNRLAKGMPLQADPTVKFATGNFMLKRISGEHLQIDSPYNTYRHNGLPPGPIRIASRKGIDAVLNAPLHEYIYMCAKEDFSGRHNFATNYAEHRKNALRYQAELNKRNIH